MVLRKTWFAKHRSKQALCFPTPPVKVVELEIQMDLLLLTEKY
jgi:hypothetical protein